MGVSEFAAMTNRHVTTVHKMIRNGTLRDSGYNLFPIRGKRRVRRWAIGVPLGRLHYHCPDCGNQWTEDGRTPSECPSCSSTNIERRAKVA